MKRLATRVLLTLIIALLLLPSATVRAEEQLTDGATATDNPGGMLDTAPETPQTSPPTVSDTQELPLVAKSLPVTPSRSAASTTTQEAPQQLTPTIEPPASQVPSPLAISLSEPLLVSAFKITPGYGFDFVEFKNTTDSMTVVNDVTVHLLYSTATEDYDCTIGMHGYVRPNSYVAYSMHSSDDGAYIVDGCPHPGEELFDQEVQVIRGSTIIESVRIAATDTAGATAKQWERKAFTASGRTGIITTDFQVPKTPRQMYTSGLYEPVPPPSLQFLEIFPRPIACSSGDESPVCRPYVKIKNTGNTAIDLSQFRLRNGALTAQSSKYNTSSLTGIVPAGEFRTIVAAADGKPLAINSEDGATWLEDAYGLQTYTNTDTPYQDAELVAQAGKSWAYDTAETIWKWAIPSPESEENNFTLPGKGASISVVSTLKPCASNQYRSLETNRCRLLSASSSTLKPCKDGQYRSEETNRCRSIAATAAAVLKPCNDDQFRNPATGRCKKIASTDDLPQPCPAGKERNPTTNRCRTIVTTDLPQTAFAVEPVKQGVKSFVGWWALGGVGIVAAGYATWEWRRELKRAIQKVATFARGTR